MNIHSALLDQLKEDKLHIAGKFKGRCAIERSHMVMYWMS